MENRYIKEIIISSLSEKIVLISGPRQVGKTTISKNIFPDYDYLNYDDSDDQKIIHDKSWDREKKLVIFDELHKMAEWKRFLKGVYDKEGISPKLIVTGSARLDTFRKVGDSLAGRFFHYRLHPFDLKELINQRLISDPVSAFETLLTVGGFPEPFLKGSEKAHRIWRKGHQDIILRQDLIDLEKVSDIRSIETLIHLLRSRVGSPVSFTSLATDLQVSHNTVKRWLVILENLFIIFRVTPYHRNVAKAILKEPKYYFYDTGSVKADEGIRLENYVACALLKELHFIEDTQGYDVGLHYLRNTQGNEVDFLVVIDDKPVAMIEVKLSDTQLSKNLQKFSKFFPKISIIQLVKNSARNYTHLDGSKVIKAVEWLSNVPLLDEH